MAFAILTMVFIVVSVVLVLVILVQRPQGGGLAGAFGGAGGGSETVFGGRVGDVLTWTTGIIFTVFLFIAIGLNLADNKSQTAAAPSAVTAPGATPPLPPIDTDAGDESENRADEPDAPIENDATDESDAASDETENAGGEGGDEG